MALSEKEALQKALDEVKATRILSHSMQGLLSEAFGGRFRNAFDAIKGSRIRKLIFSPSNRVLWLVSGKGREYMILPYAGFCSCEDFYFRVISNEEYLCYHLLAQRLAETLQQYATFEEQDDRYHELTKKILAEGEHPRKLPIRDVENIRRVMAGILSEEGNLPLDRLLQSIQEAGYPVLSKRHLAAVLVADKARRFICVDGRWSLGKT